MPCTDCNDTNVPEVDNSSIECCELVSDKCVVTSEAVPCLQVGKGATLTHLFKRLCLHLKKLSFLRLFDTPSSYSGSAGSSVIVNEDEDGLEFSDCLCLKESESVLETQDLLDLHNTPFELLPNPGVGKYYRVIDFELLYTAGSNPFSVIGSSEMLETNWGEGVLPIIANSNVTTNDFILNFSSHFSYLQMNKVPNTAYTLSTSSGNPITDGDGTLKIKLIYRTEEI